MQTDVEIIRGTTNTFEITVTDDLGELYKLSAQEKLLFGVKKNHTDSDYIIVKSVKAGDGVYSVTLHPKDTEKCECGKYFYDVSIQANDELFNVIEASSFFIKKNVTSWGCVD